MARLSEVGCRWLVIWSLALVCLIAFDAGQSEAMARDRSLTLHNTHTGERQTIKFKRNGRYIQSGLRDLNRFLRDWRRNESTNMDPKLFDLLWEVYRESRAKGPINVVSGYRSPATNEMLRSRSRGVAKNSRHTRGQAMDFYIPGVPMSRVREIALKKQVGGVGYYPKSRNSFVHLDTGNVRHWPRMSHRQLMALFPDGKTLHLPSDGKPLKGYQLAFAERNRRGLSSSSSSRRGTSSERTVVARRSRANDDPSRTRNASSATRTARADTSSSSSTPRRTRANDDITASNRNDRGTTKTASTTDRNENSNESSNEGGNQRLPGQQFVAGLFAENGADTSDAEHVASANISASSSELPGVSAAIPDGGSRPRFASRGETQPADSLSAMTAVPRARPKATFDRAVAQADETPSPAPAANEQPGDIPFQVASAETEPPSSAGGITQAFTNTSKDRLAATRGLFEQPTAGTQTAASEAALKGETFAFIPRRRPVDDGGLNLDGIDPIITSTPDSVILASVTDAREALAFQANGTASRGAPRTGTPAGPGVLAYAGLGGGLPQIPEPASAADALPDQRLTLPVSTSATETISAEEIVEIFAGGRADPQPIDPATSDLPATRSFQQFESAEAAVTGEAVEQHERIVSRFISAQPDELDELLHPDQRSMGLLLAIDSDVSNGRFEKSYTMPVPTGQFRLTALVRHAFRQ